jgi:hypothetical protein
VGPGVDGSKGGSDDAHDVEYRMSVFYVGMGWEMKVLSIMKK